MRNVPFLAQLVMYTCWIERLSGRGFETCFGLQIAIFALSTVMGLDLVGFIIIAVPESLIWYFQVLQPELQHLLLQASRAPIIISATTTSMGSGWKSLHEHEPGSSQVTFAVRPSMGHMQSYGGVWWGGQVLQCGTKFRMTSNTVIQQNTTIIPGYRSTSKYLEVPGTRYLVN